MKDLIIIGAGPCGLACAAAAQKAGLDYLVVEKGCLTDALTRFPTYMTFFSTPELLEIAGMPFTTGGEKPTRLEALKYYRRVAQLMELRVLLYRRVDKIERIEGGFRLSTVGYQRDRGALEARRVVVATGYMDTPRLLGVPGEELPHVSHYYIEGHPFFGQKVLVVGGKNSAVEAALDLYRHGAEVTLVHRGPALGENVKPWILPDVRHRLEKGEIRGLFNTVVRSIAKDKVLLETEGQSLTLPADFVFLMTGYSSDTRLLQEVGVRIDPATGIPEHNGETMETNVPGLYLAGVIAAGHDANKIFIENGRSHGEMILNAITGEG